MENTGIRQLTVKMNQAVIPFLGRKMYSSDFSFVILRELIQNSLDANSTKIDVLYDPNTRELVVSDNGVGIPEVENLLDTIGASLKLDDIENIGGYGLAKLAIFGCKNWKFTSKSGSFYTGFMYNPIETLQNGTMVSCEFLPSDVDSWFIGKIKSYCKSINRNCEFTLNGDILNGLEYNRALFGNKEELISSTNNNGYIIVRVNGLPTFKQSIANLEKTIFIDYQVNVSPYDDNYPLTSNRDSFISGTEEYTDFENRKKAIQLKLESDKKLAENIAKKESQTTFRNKKYVSGGSVTTEDYKNYSMEISTWERYIKQIADVMGYSIENCTFGLSDGLQENAYYNPSNCNFCLAVGRYNKGMILSLAMHEFVHFMGYGMYGHDQNFSSKLTFLTGVISEKVFNGEFRK